jgi:hypothetical protein
MPIRPARPSAWSGGRDSDPAKDALTLTVALGDQQEAAYFLEWR